MGETYKRDRCGALGHKSAICRAPHDFWGVCSTCGAFGHMARQCRTAAPTLTHENILAAPPYGPPSPQDHYSSAPPPPGAWPQHQTGFVFHGDELDGGGVGGGVQQWDGGGVGGGEPYWDGGGVGGGVQGQPEPGSGEAGELTRAGPLSSTIESQVTSSSDQQVKWPPLFVAHLTSLGKCHALSVGGDLVRTARSGSKIMIGDRAASIHCTGDCTLFYNKRPPTPAEKVLIVGDGQKLEVGVFGCVDLVMHCAEDVAVTLRNVSYVPGVPFDLSFNVIQEEQVITLDHNGAHMLNGRVFFRKGKIGNYVKVTGVARHEKPPALAAVVLRPGGHRWIGVNDLHCSLGHAHDTVVRENARQMGIMTGSWGYSDGCAGGEGIRKAIANSTSCRAEKRMQRLFTVITGPLPTSSGGARYCLMIVDDATNVDWPVYLPGKSATTVTLVFSTYLPGVRECLRKAWIPSHGQRLRFH